ncbi:unnamed protein product [Cylindrotheca closterium]|uniref:Helicase-associated domain-containing protein n=1 Tax=Cylindrotheca closterium TaxID=2856 RepID=A0AAD2FCT7_9STRA|nr:unnamed protein product [Cylindrotheca closterium]
MSNFTTKSPLFTTTSDDSMFLSDSSFLTISSFDSPFEDPGMEPLPIAPHALPRRLSIVSSSQTLPSRRTSSQPPSNSLLSLLGYSLHRGIESEGASLLTATESEFDRMMAAKTRKHTNLNKRGFASTRDTEKKRPKKRMKESEGAELNLRPYQETQWHEQYHALCDFCQQDGHCNVSDVCSDDIVLVRWAKRQRYQYKLLQQGMSSTMTTGRIRKLEAIGFVWDIHAALWEERLAELTEFRKQWGHCIVPSIYKGSPVLATWVKCQRRQYKNKLLGRKSNITDERIAALERLGFAWGVRGGAW